MDDQIVAGAQDAARQLGWKMTASTVSHHPNEDPLYSFGFDASGREARVAFSASKADVLSSGLTPRDYSRYEIVDAFRDPAA